MAQAAQAQAQVVSAIAALRNYRQQVQSAEHSAQAAQARVGSAQAQADRAARDAARYRTLYSQDAVSAQVYDQAQAQAQDLAAQLQAARAEAAQARSQVDSAKAAVAQAQDQVSAARDSAKASREQVRVARAGLGLAVANTNQIGIQESSLLSTSHDTGASQADVASAEAGQQQVAMRQKQILTYKAQALQAQAALTNAKITLNDTYIYSPCDGEVVRKDSNEGATMAPGTTIVTLTQRDRPLWIEANFKETQLTEVRVGQAVSIDVDAFPGRVFRGRVQSVLSATGASTALLPPDNATGNFTKVVQRIPVRIELLPGQGGGSKEATLEEIRNLRLGMSVTATIDTSSSAGGSGAGGH